MKNEECKVKNPNSVRSFCILHFALAFNWWPARVTRPVLRIKSPLHHFNACRPEKWVYGRHEEWSPHPGLHRAETRVPGECIADNTLGALRMVGARRIARPRLPDSESGRSAFPREPRAVEDGVPDRLRSGDLLHERQACWTGLHYGDELGRAGRFAPPT